jgi:predicted TPR repeat methyltransferase
MSSSSDDGATGQPAAPRDGEDDGATLTLSEAMDLAMGLHKKGLLDAAEEIYGRVLAAAPEQVDALHLLGLCRYQRGQHAEGLSLVLRALAGDPDHVEARNSLGNMLLERRRFDEAEAAYRQVLARRPEYPAAHANLGLLLQRRGDLAGAEAEFRQAVTLDPEHGGAHHNLGSLLWDEDRMDESLTFFQRALTLMPYDGESYLRLGAALSALERVAEAVAVYERWLELEPGSPVASHMLAASSGHQVPGRAADAFVESTFDAFAGSFDLVLTRLQYRAPALVAEAVAAAVGAAAGDLDVLDVGAGTGLCGPLLRPYAKRLVGIDLSRGMLAKARERAIYDVLEAAELTRYLRQHPDTFDLVVSADTLVYFGDLSEALGAASASLRAGGHLIFTVERITGQLAPDHRLNSHGRYSHQEGYVVRALSAVGLVVSRLEEAILRLEHKVPVEGLVVTARKQPPLR